MTIHIYSYPQVGKINSYLARFHDVKNDLFHTLDKNFEDIFKQIIEHSMWSDTRMTHGEQ